MLSAAERESTGRARLSVLPCAVSGCRVSSKGRVGSHILRLRRSGRRVTPSRNASTSIARNGFVLESDNVGSSAVQQLDELGYLVIRLDASHWSDGATMLADFASALEFPDYFGGNLDALNDCLGDVAERRYGWRDGVQTGLVIHVAEMSSCRDADPQTAEALVTILRGNAGYAALFGTRVLAVLS